MPLELELCPGRWVGGQHPCFIIAEIGQNHQGDLEVAKRMIRTAKVRAEPGRERAPAGGGGGAEGRVAGEPAAGSGDCWALLLSVARARPDVPLASSVSKSLESCSSLSTLLTCPRSCGCRPTRPLPPPGGRIIFLKQRFGQVVPLPHTFTGSPLSTGGVETLEHSLQDLNDLVPSCLPFFVSDLFQRH